VSDVARVDSLQKVAEERIFTVRSCQVVLDSDLAEFYGVPTGILNRQVKRNEARFPEDFRFQLTQEEHEALLCQNGIAKPGRGGRRNLPWAYTSKGALTTAGVLKTEQADVVAVAVARAFEWNTKQSSCPIARVRKAKRLSDRALARSACDRAGKRGAPSSRASCVCAAS
jgi:hypothetical protein